MISADSDIESPGMIHLNQLLTVALSDIIWVAKPWLSRFKSWAVLFFFSEEDHESGMERHLEMIVFVQLVYLSYRYLEKTNKKKWEQTRYTFPKSWYKNITNIAKSEVLWGLVV